MSNVNSSNQIKFNNRDRIYRYVYQHPAVSQQDISFELRLSRPTVTNNLAVLEQTGMIIRSGQTETGLVGRKATAYSINAQHRIAFGVEFDFKDLTIVAVDLYGNLIQRKVFLMDYDSTDEYFEVASQHILSFVREISKSEEQVLGIGFSMQGLVNVEKNRVSYGKIIDYTGFTLDSFASRLPYPCVLEHDAVCAAFSELWSNPHITNAVYLFISGHLGAAMIVDRKVIFGKHGHNCTLEHLRLFDRSKPCYCGKSGCVETECCIHSLLEEGETLETFMHMARAGKEPYAGRWKKFLEKLAVTINAVHLVFDADFILGGTLAPYFTEQDVDFLHEEVAKLTPFDDFTRFIHISKMPEYNSIVGAALPYIDSYLENLTWN